MQKFILLFIAIAATIITVVTLGQKPKSGISSGGSTIAPTKSVLPSSVINQDVPLPTGEDVIRSFVQLIHEKKIPEAIGLMDETLITSDSVKQEYGVVFNSFSSIAISKIGLETFGKEDWKEGEERFRVDLQISIKPQSQKSMWDEGATTRWITVVKKEGRFMIHDIATGP
ncbi:hypothetical protein MUP56_03025 [Patescibacteria group bacterium]|nr:hypothetical protein [Patescibacteria group bacterium]